MEAKTDQTEWKSKLIKVFAGEKNHFVNLSYCAIIQDVQWNDIDYAINMMDFTTDLKKFGNQSAMVDEFHKRGLHYIIITVSYRRKKITIMHTQEKFYKFGPLFEFLVCIQSLSNPKMQTFVYEKEVVLHFEFCSLIFELKL